MGLYFEEFIVGQKIVTEKRTITEDDIMTFAKLSGDDNRIYTDPEFSKTTPFGRQIAHGLLGLSIASGLSWQTGLMDGTVIAFREVKEWKFVKPVFIGDTIYTELETVETRLDAGSYRLGFRPCWAFNARPADYQDGTALGHFGAAPFPAGRKQYRTGGCRPPAVAF